MAVLMGSIPNAQELNFLVPLPVVFPLLASAFLAAFRKPLGRRGSDATALFAAGVCVVVCILLLLSAKQHTIVYWFGNWYPRGSTVLGISFVIDPVAAGLASLCAILTFLALMFSWRIIEAGSNHLQPLMLVFLAGMSGFCLTGDLFNMFVFFELMSTAAFALTGLKTGEPEPLQGAFNFAVTNTVAAFMVLTGIALLYSMTGALNLAQIGLALVGRHDAPVLFACSLITCGFFTKAAVVPFHFWLPDAHAVSPTPVCVLFSGMMVELGLYAVLRIYAVIFIPALNGKEGMLRGILLFLGTLTAIKGGVMCYAQHHLKRLLAFSTISHAGLMLVALALQGTLASAGMLLYLAGHAFVKSALFFVAGILLHKYRTASEPYLFRCARGQWLPGTLWFLGGLGLAGFPIFATMLGSALTENAAESLRFGWIGYVFIFSGVMTGGAVFRVGFHTFFGWGEGPISDQAAEIDEKPETGKQAEVPWYLLLPPALCIASAIALTLIPGVRENVLLAAHRLWMSAAYLHATYTSGTVLPPLPHDLKLDAGKAGLHGIIAGILGIVLALTSVFRGKLMRYVRVGAFLEGPLLTFRAIQSGDVGDYVAWMTVGISLIGAAFVFLLR